MSNLRDAAQAVVDRWDSPNWKRTGPTGEAIDALRIAVAAHVEPVAARECRMLRPDEIDSIADRCEGLGDLAYERELQDKFAAVNGLTIKEPS